jgi:stearoyl-CoA desaturase (Delta-9 desaturase)
LERRHEVTSIAVAFGCWFDNTVGGPQAATTGDYSVDGFRCLPFRGIHAMCLGGIWVGWNWIAVGVAPALFFIWMFAITGFYHRYFSHKSDKTSRGVQMAFAIVANSSAQRGPLCWAAHHRHHHLYPDMESDPYSPRQHGLLWSDMGWVISRANLPTRSKLLPDLKKYPEL